MTSLVELLEEHLAFMKSLNYSRFTVRSYNQNCHRALVWLAETYALTAPDQLRPKHLQSWQMNLAGRRTSKGLPLKPRTINKEIETMFGFLRYLADRGHIQRALVSAIRFVKVPQFLPGSVLSHDQVRRLLDHIDTGTTEGFTTRVMMELLYTSGIRVAELLDLQIDRIDYRNCTAVVTGKGRKDRVVPIGKTAMHYVETYVKAVRPNLGASTEQKTVFLDRAGQPVRYAHFLRTVHECAKNAGLDINVTPHTFRRSCATELLRGGAGMYHPASPFGLRRTSEKELLGHESLDTIPSTGGSACG